jgi:N-succinyldiaminopimelate aminotransferase
MLALRAHTQVVIFEPFFPWYPAIVRAAGGVPRFVTLDAAHNFALPPPDVLARAFRAGRTKMCIFNTPHNPTGRVATREELEGLAQLCVSNDVVCLSDEVYESCIFPGGGGGACDESQRQHVPMALLPGMAERTITVGSASKLLSVTGWRVGWAISHSRPLLDVTATMHSFNTFCAPTPLQWATAHAIEGLMRDAAAGTSSTEHHDGGGGRALDRDRRQHPLDISGVAATFQRNAREITNVLEALGLDVFPCESGYFVVADVQKTGACVQQLQ